MKVFLNQKQKMILHGIIFICLQFQQELTTFYKMLYTISQIQLRLFQH